MSSHMADIEVSTPVSAADAGESRPRQRARRQATEDAIIDAFERVLVRDGVSGLGVNGLIKEAGVGKKQVYDYFGGLPGVATEWVTRRGVWPGIEALIGEPLEAFTARPPAERLLRMNRGCADMLRRNAPLCELLTGEFTRSPEVKDAVEHVRQLIRLDFERVMMTGEDMAHPDLLALNTVAYSAATYLGLRAHSQPVFFGFDLSVETSWRTIAGMFERIIQLAGERAVKSS
jgi:AcrR family transcriptional regulator